MVAKIPEATGRHVASFVLGSAATLTVVFLLQYRPPAEVISSARPPAQYFSGWSGDRRNGTSAATSVRVIASGEGDDRQAEAADGTEANTTVLHGPLPVADLEEESSEFRGLAVAVERAATEDRTVIITCVNHAWSALLDLFLESFRIGDGVAHLLEHVLIVAMDPTALARCRVVHRHCYLYTIHGVDFSSEKFFLSPEYLELVWSKLKLQRRVLELGYSFLFTDVDVMWFRNPLKHVTVYADMAISSDVFNGDPESMDNFPNTGFFHVKPNSRTIAMTRRWHEARSAFPGMNEQPVFNRIKKEMVRELRLRVQHLDTAYMGGFCSYGKDLRKICTMHANCCVGLAPKLRDLRTVLDDWKNYTRLPGWAKHTARWTVPGACIH